MYSDDIDLAAGAIWCSLRKITKHQKVRWDMVKEDASCTPFYDAAIAAKNALEGAKNGKEMWR